MTLGTLLARGRTADVHAWEDGRVIKLFQPWVSESSVEYEAAAGLALNRTELPAPRLRDQVTVDGRHGLVYDRVDGRTMLHELRAHPWRIRAMGRQLADLHAQVHAAQTTDLPDQRDRLRWKIEHAEPLPDAHKRAALDALAALPGGEAVLHGDFHPDNVLLSPDGPVIIDWHDASRGNPLADVARTLLLLSVGEAPDTPPLMRWLSNRVRGVLRGAYLAQTCARRGITPASIARWELPTYAARLGEGIPEERASLLARVRALVDGR